MTPPRNPVKVCSRIGLALFLMLLVWFSGANILSAVLLATNASLLNNAWVVWLANDIPLYLIAMPVFLLVLRSIPDGPDYTPARPAPAARNKVPVGPLRYLAMLAFSIGAAQLLGLIVAGLIYLLQQALGIGGIFGDSALADIANMDNVFANLVFGACVPALGEEFIFRHMLHRKMNGCSDKTYIFTSGLCFALFHINISQMPYAFVLGAFFAWLYLATKNIWLPVSLHFFVNLFGLVLAPFAEANELVAALTGLLLLGLMILAVVLFFAYRKRIMASFQPPTEPGWWHKPSAPVQRLPWQSPRWPEAPNAGWAPAAAPYAPWAPAQPPYLYPAPYTQSQLPQQASYSSRTPVASPGYIPLQTNHVSLRSHSWASGSAVMPSAEPASAFQAPGSRYSACDEAIARTSYPSHASRAQPRALAACTHHKGAASPGAGSGCFRFAKASPRTSYPPFTGYVTGKGPPPRQAAAPPPQAPQPWAHPPQPAWQYAYPPWYPQASSSLANVGMVLYLVLAGLLTLLTLAATLMM